MNFMETELRGDLLVHEQNEAEDVGHNVENGGAIDHIGGGFDIRKLHLRASFAFFHPRCKFIRQTTSNCAEKGLGVLLMLFFEIHQGGLDDWILSFFSTFLF